MRKIPWLSLLFCLPANAVTMQLTAAPAVVVPGSTVNLTLSTLGGTSFTTNASTTGTWSSGSQTITVASTTNIAVWQGVTGTGIGAGSVVLSIAGNVLTLSGTTTAPGSGTAVSFTGCPTVSANYGTTINSQSCTNATTIAVNATFGSSVGTVRFTPTFITVVAGVTIAPAFYSSYPFMVN